MKIKIKYMEFLQVQKLNDVIKKMYDVCIQSDFAIRKKTISIEDSLNLISTSDIIAPIDVPTFRRSTVDGYAVISKDTNGASENIPCFLKIVGESRMGEICDIDIKNGECVYVPTGGMIPDNADAVVMIEWVENFSSDKLAIYKSIGSSSNVVSIGDDNKKGEILISKGHYITASDIGLLASNGIKNVEVYDGFNVSIISTGDELVDIKCEKNISQIYDINTYTLSAECKKNNFNIVDKMLLKDDKNILKEKISRLMNVSDVILVSGGSSKGKKDNTLEVINELCSNGVMAHGIAIKPGKPTIVGYDDKAKCAIIGLPGHPVASVMLYKFLLYELYYMLTHDGKKQKKLSVKGKMCENIFQSPGRLTIQLVTIDDNSNVNLVLGRSGLIKTLSKANGYIVIDEYSEGINVGETVEVYLL